MRALREGLRACTSAPGLSTLAVVALALGLGVAMAVFGVVDALLFRPLPVREPGRLVRVFTVSSRGGADTGRLSLPYYRALQSGLTSVQGLSAFREGILVHFAGSGASAEAVDATLVSGTFFEALGVSPALGRALARYDDQSPGANAVAMLSHGFWRRRFAERPDVIGSAVRLNGRSYTVVGVTPASFQGVGLERAPDLYLPLSMYEEAEPVARGQLEFPSMAPLECVGRLAAGFTLAQAQAEADALADRLGAGRPATSGHEMFDPEWRTPWPRLLAANAVAGERFHGLAWLLTFSVALVLLIAVADTSNLLVARADRRSKDVAIRMAIGATRSQVVQERLVEGLLLTALAALLAVPAAIGVTRLLLASVPEPAPLPFETATALLSLRGLAATALVALLVGVSASVLPALRATATDPASVLRTHDGLLRAGGLSVRRMLVVLQVALSLALLAGTGLLLRSLQAGSRVSVGFDPEPLLVASIQPAKAGYDVPRALALQSELRARLLALPSVEAVAIGTSLPFEAAPFTTVRANGRPQKAGLEAITPGYPQTLGLALLRGRDLTIADEYAALVDETLASRFWPGEDPIGKRIEDISPRRASVEVVGVLHAELGNPRQPAPPLFFVPRATFFGAFPFQPRTALFIRTKGDPRDLMPSVAGALQTLDADLPLLGLRPAREHMRRPFARARLLATCFAALAVIALTLAGAGLFGLMASATEARRREIGIRIALGAAPREVVALVLGHSARLVGLGMAMGLPLALGMGRLLSAFLFGVMPYDAIALSTTAVLLGATAFLAAYGPTRRALSVDPMRVLRAE
jgi:predicted permease